MGGASGGPLPHGGVVIWGGSQPFGSSGGFRTRGEALEVVPPSKGDPPSDFAPQKQPSCIYLAEYVCIDLSISLFLSLSLSRSLSLYIYISIDLSC